MTEPARPPDQHLADPFVACDQPECTRTDHTIGFLRSQNEALSRRVEELEAQASEDARLIGSLTTRGARAESEANRLKDKLAEALKMDRAEYDEIEASVSARPKPHTPDDHASSQAARRYENHLEQIKDHGP